MLKYNSFLLKLLTIVFISNGSLQAQAYEEKSNDVGIFHSYNHREFLGGGTVVFDYNNDGFEDIYLTSGWDQDRLYKNNGNGTYTEVSDEAKLRDTRLFYTTGAIAGDIDNDGDRDLFVSTRGSASGSNGPNLLFRNNGDGTFSDIWRQTQPEDRVWSMGALFIDYNLDGLLDIYSIGYIDELRFLRDTNDVVYGFNHDCFTNRFYKNLGDGQFQEVTEELGLLSEGCALAVTANDFDMDGDIDIYLINDFGEFVVPNQLFRNDFNESGKFVDISAGNGTDIGIYGMGIASGDIDNDGDFDFYTTNIGRNVLLKNEAETFTDITQFAGVENQWIIEDSLRTTGWGTNMLDFDNDGDLDLFVSNGIIPAEGFIKTGAVDPNKLYENDSEGNFTDISTGSGVDWHTIGRGSATGDFDNDGDIDIIQTAYPVNIEGQSGKSLYFENKNSENNWIKIKLKGTHVNADAIGSKVYTYSNGQRYLREIEGGSSHNSQNSVIAHFGLGTAMTVDSVKVIWTGGNKQQTIFNPPVNSIQLITEKLSSPTIELSKSNSGISLYPNPVSDNLNITIDFPETRIQHLYLINILGKKIELPYHQNQVLNLSNISKGIYILIFETNKGSFHSKIEKL